MCKLCLELHGVSVGAVRALFLKGGKDLRPQTVQPY